MTALPHIWTPNRKLWTPTEWFTAGKGQRKSDGKLPRKTSSGTAGKTPRNTGAGSTCCCAAEQLYRARNCIGGLVNLYVPASHFLTFPTTFWFKYAGSCYQVRSTDTASAGSTPVVDGSEVSTGTCCGCKTCSNCPGGTSPANEAPQSFLCTFTGVTLASTCSGVTITWNTSINASFCVPYTDGTCLAGAAGGSPIIIESDNGTPAFTYDLLVRIAASTYTVTVQSFVPGGAFPVIFEASISRSDCVNGGTGSNLTSTMCATYSASTGFNGVTTGTGGAVTITPQFSSCC